MIPDLSAEQVGSVTLASGATVFVDLADPRGRSMINNAGDLNPQSRLLWQHLLARRSWDVVADVGANYGEMLLGVQLPPGAQVMAFEPLPEVFLLLRRSLAEAGLTVDLRPLALSEQQGESVLFRTVQWSGTSSLVEPAPAVEVERLTVRVSTFAAELGSWPGAAVVVKVDAEGHDLHVLKGALPALAQLDTLVAMVEVAHMAEAEIQWLLDNTRVYAWASDAGRLCRFALSPGRLREAMTSGVFYPQDVACVLKGSLG